MGRTFTDAVRDLWRTFAELFNPYHPELHYMRGPGPKWHAKRSSWCPQAGSGPGTSAEAHTSFHPRRDAG